MKLGDAVTFLRPAISAGSGGSWADLGAGRGTFTEALATILGPEGIVFALDVDPESVRALEALRDLGHSDLAPVVAVYGDFRDPDSIPELQGRTFDGVVFANALHFVSDAEAVLRRIRPWIRPGGRVVVIEYDRTTSNPWVPYPLPPSKLQALTAAAGFTAAEVVAQRPSRYHRRMYCATALLPDASVPADRSAQ